jgi:tight adherence protein B
VNPLLNMPTEYLAYAGGGLLVAGGSLAFGLSMRPTGTLGKALARYIAHLDAECRFQFYSIDGRQFFIRQIAAIVLAIVACVTTEAASGWLVPPLVLVGPHFVLRFLRKKRIERLEGQLDGWLLILSNMLKAAGALGDAMLGSVDLIRAPLRQELDVVLKEVRLGATLEDALRAMGARVKSTTLGTVVTLLLVGRRTGGEMPGLLETAAATLREMQRLDKLIRAKTADGRIQTLVLASAPVGIYLGFRMVDPHFFDPLYANLLGYTLLGGAALLWVLALVSARKILNVDY